MRGGARPGAGRPAGSLNQRTADQIAAAEASGIMPLDFLLAVMRDEGQDIATRIDAAHKAAPFVHPKLSSVQQTMTLQASDPIAELMQTVASDGRSLRDWPIDAG